MNINSENIYVFCAFGFLFSINIYKYNFDIVDYYFY